MSIRLRAHNTIDAFWWGQQPTPLDGRQIPMPTETECINYFLLYNIYGFFLIILFKIIQLPANKKTAQKLLNFTCEKNIMQVMLTLPFYF